MTLTRTFFQATLVYRIFATIFTIDKEGVKKEFEEYPINETYGVVVTGSSFYSFFIVVVYDVVVVPFQNRRYGASNSKALSTT